jgi:hypothetical protein
MAGVRRLPLRLIAVSASIGLVATGCGESSRSTVVRSSGSPVVRVSTFPWPEGRLGPVAAVRGVPGVYVPLREIRSAMPKTLPENPKQECGAGATVVVVLENGRTRTYGPCHRPLSIEHLRLALVRAAERRYPARPPRRPVTGPRVEEPDQRLVRRPHRRVVSLRRRSSGEQAPADVAANVQHRSPRLPLLRKGCVPTGLTSRRVTATGVDSS